MSCQCAFAIKCWTVETAIDNFRYFYTFVIQYSVTPHDRSANYIHSICFDINERSKCHLQPSLYAERAQRHFSSYIIVTNRSVTEIGRTILPLHGNIHEICLIDSRIFNRIYYDLIVIVVYKHKVLAENVELNDWAIQTVRIGIVQNWKRTQQTIGLYLLGSIGQSTSNRIIKLKLNINKISLHIPPSSVRRRYRCFAYPRWWLLQTKNSFSGKFHSIRFDDTIFVFILGSFAFGMDVCVWLSVVMEGGCCDCGGKRNFLPIKLSCIECDR